MGAELGDGGLAVHARHHEVDDGDVRAVLARGLDGRGAVVRLGDDNEVVLGRDEGLEPGSDDLVVVDDEDSDSLHGCSVGRVTATVTFVPPPGWLEMDTSPPRLLARSRTP